MTDTDRQDERSWWVSVPIQASDSLADVQTRLLDHIREGAESRASAPIPRSLALRLLAEDNESVTAWTGHTTHPHPSLGAQGWEGFASMSGSASIAAQEPEHSVPTGTAASEPVGRGYPVMATTHRVPPSLRCSICEREIISGTQYKRVTIGCQAFRVHDGCLARVQRQIAQALEESSPGTDDELEEDADGND